MNNEQMQQYLQFAIDILNEHSQYDGDDGSAEADARDGLQLVLLELKDNK